MLKRISGLAIILLISEVHLLSQIKDIGIPFIRNFSKNEYKAGTQNWSVAQDLKGFMYFANNEGLLVFDGVQWELFKLPNFSITRSVYIDNKGEIYIGAYNDLGKMVPGRNGKLTFRSLKESIPAEYRNFDDVWSICPYQGKIVYQSYNALYIYEENKPIIVVKARSRIPFAFPVSGRIIVNDEEAGLMELSGTSLIPLSGIEKLKNAEISSILPFERNDHLLISTKGQGMYLYDGTSVREWNVPVNELLIKNQIFSATTLLNDYFAMGTIQDGVIIIDKKGNLIQSINKKIGLQDNTILRVFADRTGNLWLGLNNGIDYVNISSPITFLQNPEGFGAGYTELIHDGKLYLGTNQGLYVADWINGKTSGGYRMIPETGGQVWYLGVHNGIILCGHDHGTFIIEREKARLISTVRGGWKYHILSKQPGYLVGGTYNGLILFRWENGSWKFLRRIAGFTESFRVFEEDDDGDLWMSHGFKGIYRVRLNETLDSVVYSRYYTKKDGLPANYTLSVFKIKNKIIFTADTTGIYEYVTSGDRFQPSPYFNLLLSPVVGFTYLNEDTAGNIWYVSYNRIGLFRIQEDFSFKQITVPFTLLAGRFIHGFESVYTYSDNQVLISIENGFAHYTPHDYNKPLPDFSTYITKIEAGYLDTVFYPRNRIPGTERGSSVLALPFRGNNLRFNFSAPVYDNPGNIQYSTKLTGYDDNWSPWSSTYYKDYNNLPDGRFTFMVKAIDPLGFEGISDTFTLTILPPWYKSIAAYIVYTLLFISILNSLQMAPQ